MANRAMPAPSSRPETAFAGSRPRGYLRLEERVALADRVLPDKRDPYSLLYDVTCSRRR